MQFKHLALAMTALSVLSCADKNFDSAVANAAQTTPAPIMDDMVAQKKSEKIYGVTLDSIAGLNDTLSSLRRFKKRATTRIVFDEGQKPAYYKDAVTKISAVSDIMGEILDSFYVQKISTANYKTRTTDFLNAFGDSVKIWEVGNEINGEWLGNATTVAAKMTAAYDLVKARGKTTALTLYYNEQCWKYPSEEMFTWAQKNVPARMKSGLDYVFVSYYEDDCNGLRPDWNRVFAKLAQMFPNSKLGFGEVGTKYAAKKQDFITRYYPMQIDLPQFVGGYFWWYFKQDMVPYTKPLWNILNDSL